MFIGPYGVGIAEQAPHMSTIPPNLVIPTVTSRWCAADCTFANLGGDDSGTAACGDCNGGVVAAGSFVHIVNSTFFDPVRRPLTSYVRAWGSGGVLLTGCTFAAPPDITRPLFYARESAVIYTDDPAIRVRSGDGGTATASPVSLVPDLPADSNRSFLQRSDPWFVNIMRVRSPFCSRSS